MASAVSGSTRSKITGLFEPVTLQQLLSRVAPARTEATRERILPPRAPEIDPTSKHWLYALAVVAGFEHEEACVQAGVSLRTPEDWKNSLREIGAAFFGRPVAYPFLALYCVYSEFREMVNNGLFPIDAAPSATADSVPAMPANRGAAAAAAALPSMGVGRNPSR